ncbi:MAG: Rieske (2Fe-2S) protein [Thermoplasmatota archaeon]
MAAPVAWTDVDIDLEAAEPMQVTTVAGRRLLFTRAGASWHVTDALCPHKFAPLEEGTLAGCHLTCPVHEATFDLRSGDPLDGDGWAGHLETYAVRQASDAKGGLQVDLP